MAQKNKNGTLVMRMACAIFFLLFTFFYLYDYQPDVLAATQHVLSHGATHYNRIIGAVIITAVLWMVQLVVYAVTRLSKRGHALTYLPSLMLLGILCDVSPDIVNGHYIGNWIWAFPLLMLAYAFVVWVVRQLETIEMPELSPGLFSRTTWINMLQMIVLAFIACGIGSSDEVFHYRMKMEDCIISHDFTRAETVGANEEKTDSSLTMLRIWALSERHQLADKIFSYPLVGGSNAMLPNGKSVKLLMAPEREIYKMLGVRFKQQLSPIVYLRQAHKKHYATKTAHEWLLCACLLDRDLDGFVRELPKYYNINGHLPKSFREALVLYTHLRQNPRYVYHSTVMDADYDDFIEMGRASKPDEKFANLKDNYGKTYWFYYYSTSPATRSLSTGGMP